FTPLTAGAGLKSITLDRDVLAPAQPCVPRVALGDVATVIYTSGTAGEPKGVCLTFDNLAQNIAACTEAAGLGQGEVFLSLLPQFHAFGLTTNTLLPLTLGATVHYLPRFTPTAVVSVIAEQRVTVFITVASMFTALAAMKDAKSEHFGSITHAVSGGEPLSMPTARRFEERFGKPICEGYGMTEASPVVTLNRPNARRLGSVGPPLPGVSVQAVDSEGRALPPGADGELLVRGHCVMRGYLNRPEQTAAAVRGGVLHTGDIGRLDADGFVYITGRAKDMLIVGGENVFPAEIESVLLEHPAVAEAAVIGVPDDLRGEVPVAFVIPAEGAAAEGNALRAFCRERLAGYKVPRDVRVSAELPRGPTGKVLKRALREQWR
ncbi:MAG: AMP-binding protein, partial [Planctomycetota bacterium]